MRIANTAAKDVNGTLKLIRKGRAKTIILDVEDPWNLRLKGMLDENLIEAHWQQIEVGSILHFGLPQDDGVAVTRDTVVWHIRGMTIKGEERIKPWKALRPPEGFLIKALVATFVGVVVLVGGGLLLSWITKLLG